MTDEQDAILDLDKDHHADAFLLAASHFLSHWPSEWTAKELEKTILADEDEDIEGMENQAKIEVWEPIDRWCEDSWQLHDLIENLALDFLNFNSRRKTKP